MRRDFSRGSFVWKARVYAQMQGKDRICAFDLLTTVLAQAIGQFLCAPRDGISFMFFFFQLHRDIEDIYALPMKPPPRRSVDLALRKPPLHCHGIVSLGDRQRDRRAVS